MRVRRNFEMPIKLEN